MNATELQNFFLHQYIDKARELSGFVHEKNVNASVWHDAMKRNEIEWRRELETAADNFSVALTTVKRAVKQGRPLFEILSHQQNLSEIYGALARLIELSNTRMVYDPYDAWFLDTLSKVTFLNNGMILILSVLQNTPPPPFRV